MSETNPTDLTATPAGPASEAIESGTQTQNPKVDGNTTQETAASDAMDTSADSVPATTATVPPPATGGLSPPPPIGTQDMNKQPLGFVRSQSPAKRPASEMDGEDEAEDYPVPLMSINNEQGGVLLGETEIVSVGPIPYTVPKSTPLVQSSSATRAPEPASETGVSTATATTIDTPLVSTSTTATAPELPSRPTSSPPTLDQQIQTVHLGIYRPMREGEEYCVLSGKWLRKFLSNDTGSDIVLTKEEAEGPLGPIDNSDLVDKVTQQKMVTEGVILLDPTNAGIPADVNGTAAEAEFNPLLPGTMGVDFEVIPLDTWEFLVKLHGVAVNSPPPLKRKAVNTQTDTHLASNIQVELYLPTFTVYRLRDPSAETTHASLGVGEKPPAKIIAGKSEKVNALLKKAKNLTGIDMSRKVRIWRLTNNGGASLDCSRSPSPANGKKGGSKGMIFDMAAFLELEAGSEKELVEIVDSTNNQNYNGKMSINLAGLGDGGDILLEEQDSHGDWISERASKVAKNNGGMFSTAKAKIGSLVNRRANSANSSRSSSPARANHTTASASMSTSIMSRGREKRSGRPLGCCGLQNLGNTCYMNSALQCLRNCEELSKYFLSGRYKKELNPSNPLAHSGNVARSYAELLGHMFSATCPTSYAPRQFKNIIGRYGPAFSGYGQQDTQEFLAFLLDGLHEDLNRIHKKPYMEKPDSTDEMVGNEELIMELAEKCWGIYKARNDSAVADLFGGMYKSTLVCPECEKVSITFDPFMDLTLPLPVENVWSREIVFYPAGGKSLLKIPVDMDRNGTIKGLKEYIGNKLKIDPRKIMGSEMYKYKFFKHYEDSRPISGEILPRDQPIFYELDEVPTNFPPPTKTRSLLSRNDWENEQLMDKMIVPVFNRKRSRGVEYFGLPFFIILDKEEQKDYNAILAKVCERYQSQTTMELFDDSDNTSGSETPDQVVVNSEDESINEGKRVSENDGEDGYVDVQMVDVGEVETRQRPKGYSQRSLDKLKPLFTMKVGTKSHGDRALQTGWTDLNASIDLASRMVRVQTPPPPTPPMRRPYGSGFQAGSDESDEDDFDKDVDETFANPPDTQDSDDDEATQVDDQTSYSLEKRRGSIGPISPQIFYGKKVNNKKSKLQREKTSGSAPSSPPHFIQQEEQGPLIRLGEAIVCEWEDQNWENIFGGRNRHDSIRGYPLWEESDMEIFNDEELLAKRRTRESRRKRGIHLEDCLAEFAKEEILSETDPWYCPRCKEFRRARKKFELWKCPDVLVIHLKRFASSRISRDKIDALIEFPVEGLNLSDRIGQKEDGKESIYDLFAVDNHYGGLGGGHYTAYAKNFENGQWYYFDDSSVTSVGNPTTAVTTAAYLLFYRRRNSKPLGGPVFEKILGDSKTSREEESGNGGADNGNDSGISDNSTSSSPRMLGGRIGGRDSADNSRPSSPLVSGRAGSSTSGFKSFGGAGSNSNLFEAAPLSVLPPSPVLSGSQGPRSSSVLPPSYTETFGPQLPAEDIYGPQVAPKVSFTFSGKLPGTPTSTTGELGDSDRDADAEVDEDMFADSDDAREKFPVLEHDEITEVVIDANEDLGGGDNGDDDGEPHDVELSPERDDDKGGMDLDA
ncbi:hypothetical protein BGX38DRAFT_1267224 [Terfezia claveryi]|nr:hypothetical protein BGX38DRAFT_1267224 [Terfezia claveryi]